jgi:hypothetical protein
VDPKKYVHTISRLTLAFYFLRNKRPFLRSLLSRLHQYKIILKSENNGTSFKVQSGSKKISRDRASLVGRPSETQKVGTARVSIAE